jgi:lysophospholipase L1-like esterase
MNSRLIPVIAVSLAVAAGVNDSKRASAGDYPTRITCEGDSLSRGFDADDQCDDLLECIGNFGDDLDYSYSCGTMPNSLRSRIGATSTLLMGANGANMMQHSAQQTTDALGGGGSHTVVIGLGSNDLMQPLGATLATQAEYRTKVRAMLTQLTSAPASQRPANVILVGVPDVVNLYNTMRNQKHFAFETCQGIWDDFRGPISSSLEVCEPKWWNPLSWLCGVANLLQKWTNWVDGLKSVVVWAWDQVGNARFPGGYVLNSAAPASNRTLAAARQQEYNAVLQQEAANFDGMGGVRVRFAGSIGAFRFDASQVSRRDCFHANRAGQKMIADKVWNDINQSVYPIAYYAGTVGTGSDVTPTADTVAPAVGTGWTGAWADNYATLRQEVSTVAGNASDPSGNFADLEVWAQNYGYDGAYACTSSPGCYLGKLREPNSSHSYMINYRDPYGNPDGAGLYDYWRTWVKPTDVKGNAGSLYAGPWF